MEFDGFRELLVKVLALSRVQLRFWRKNHQNHVWNLISTQIISMLISWLQIELEPSLKAPRNRQIPHFNVKRLISRKYNSWMGKTLKYIWNSEAQKEYYLGKKVHDIINLSYLIGNEAGFLKLPEELDWQNQVHRM